MTLSTDNQCLAPDFHHTLDPFGLRASLPLVDKVGQLPNVVNFHLTRSAAEFATFGYQSLE